MMEESLEQRVVELERVVRALVIKTGMYRCAECKRWRTDEPAFAGFTENIPSPLCESCRDHLVLEAHATAETLGANDGS